MREFEIKNVEILMVSKGDGLKDSGGRSRRVESTEDESES